MAEAEVLPSPVGKRGTGSRARTKAHHTKYAGRNADTRISGLPYKIFAARYRHLQHGPRGPSIPNTVSGRHHHAIEHSGHQQNRSNEGMRRWCKGRMELPGGEFYGWSNQQLPTGLRSRVVA